MYIVGLSKGSNLISESMAFHNVGAAYVDTAADINKSVQYCSTRLLCKHQYFICNSILNCEPM